MKYLVIAFAVLAILAAVQAKPFLPGLDVVTKAVSSAAGAVVGGASGAIKGGVEGIKSGLKNGVGDLTDSLHGRQDGVDLLDIGRGLINQ